jgi:hypothetical protein
LFLDDVVIAHLLAFFDPTLRSLRTIEDFSQTQQAQRHLSVRRLCKSTLSDFHRVADPTRELTDRDRREGVLAEFLRGGDRRAADVPADRRQAAQVCAEPVEHGGCAAERRWRKSCRSSPNASAASPSTGPAPKRRRERQKQNKNA